MDSRPTNQVQLSAQVEAAGEVRPQVPTGHGGQQVGLTEQETTPCAPAVVFNLPAGEHPKGGFDVRHQVPADGRAQLTGLRRFFTCLGPAKRARR